jgi:hypothetical protein
MQWKQPNGNLGRLVEVNRERHAVDLPSINHLFEQSCGSREF